jgi:Flp pilus assembly protein TadG
VRFLKNLIGKQIKNNNGISMLMFVILFPLFMGFCGIAIDAGNIAYHYSLLRNSVRYAAYSGGSQSIAVPSGGFEITDINKAQDVATKKFKKNFGDSSNVKFKAKATKKAIRCQASITVKLYFMPILGAPSSIPLGDYYDVRVS